MWVEAWSPEYGTSYGIDAPDPDASEAPGAAGAQAVPAEDVPWAPIAPAAGELPPVAFLDGVSRVDARVFLEAGGELVAGLCGSVGVGAMKTNGTTRFGATRVHRALVMPQGQHAEMPFVSQVLHYESRQATGPRPEDTRFALEALREEREGLLAASLAERAAGWELPAAPILADCAYGDDTAFRTGLRRLGREYVLAVSAQIGVYGPETAFAVPERNGSVGRRRSVARPDAAKLLADLLFEAEGTR